VRMTMDEDTIIDLICEFLKSRNLVHSFTTLDQERGL
jgi:hypothetical protein